ncbi:MAG TPA: hypothetical protein DCY13_09710 [Verrucomicrobiales bacterium]|nr:hypothetical protein [Verrucomicrobiales bacterium]
MHTILHIKSDTADVLAERIIAVHMADESIREEIVDLNVDQPDYAGLLEKIFAADAVAVW